VRALPAVGALLVLTAVASAEDKQWPQHDEARPQPTVVAPGPPPSDAIVLFDGKDLSKWRSSKDGSAAKWKVDGGAMEVNGTGGIQTEQGFGDCQLHVEWMAPMPKDGKGQDRGNSGVYLMGMYEIQVLDSYQATTYPDGQAAAIYGQYPPLVNAARPPGEWQTYDIVFRAPRFEGEKVVRPARVTVLHNGVLVQDNQELMGPTANKARPPYKAHAAKLPLSLQDHQHPVRFRNIWIRELP
jgi:hypothetical protein